MNGKRVDKSLDFPMFSNIIINDDYYTQLKEAARETKEFLKEYCGPYARNAILKTILTDGSSLTSTNAKLCNRATKDGIKILTQLYSEEPIVRMFHEYTRHVGSLVDATCHDGTTTSMMTFSAIAYYLIDLCKNKCATSGPDSHRNRIRLVRSIKEVIEDCERVVKESSFSYKEIEDQLKGEVSLPDIKYSIAFHEALLSSKGDVELAHLLGTLISSFPLELRGVAEIGNSILEKEDRFVLQQRDYEFKFRCHQLSPEFLNNKLEQKLDLKDCDVFIAPGTFNQTNIFAHMLTACMLDDQAVRDLTLVESGSFALKQEIEDGKWNIDKFGLSKSFIGKKPFVVLIPEAKGYGNLIFDQVVRMRNTLYPEAPLIPIVMLLPLGNAHLVSDLILTCADKVTPDKIYTGNVEGLVEKDYEHSVVHGVHVVSKGNDLFLDDVFVGDVDGVHVSYKDPERNPYYTYLLSHIQKRIDDVNKGHIGNVEEVALRTELITLYRQATHKRFVDLFKGGTTYDMVNNEDVVEDSLGACMSVLEEGFILTGYCKLAHHCYCCSVTETNPFKKELYHVFYNAFLETLQAIYKSEPEDITLRLEKVNGKNFYLKADIENGFEGVWENFLHQTNDLPTLDENMSLEDKLKAVSSQLNFREAKDPTVVEVFLTDFVKVAHLKNQAEKEGKNPIEVLKDIEPLPIQPITGYLETFKRYKSLLPDLINSNGLIRTEER